MGGVKKRGRLKLVHSAPVMSSEPTPERVLRSGGHFEEGNDRAGKITTFYDYPLAMAHRTGVITLRQREAGEKYHFHWNSAGLGRTTPTILPWNPIIIGGESFAGPPRSEGEMNHRIIVRTAWATIGFVRARLVESGVCWQWPVPWDSPRMQWALNSLANHWNLPSGT